VLRRATGQRRIDSNPPGPALDAATRDHDRPGRNAGPQRFLADFRRAGDTPGPAAPPTSPAPASTASPAAAACQPAPIDADLSRPRPRLLNLDAGAAGIVPPHPAARSATAQ